MINISEKNSKTDEYKKFEKTEWATVDREHYNNRDIDFESKYFFLEAREKGELFGVADMKIQAGVCEIDTVLISHKKRGQGIGKQLVQKVEEIAKKEGAHKLFLITGKHWKAVDFYNSLNYEITGERKNDLGNVDFVEFTKFI